MGIDKRSLTLYHRLSKQLTTNAETIFDIFDKEELSMKTVRLTTSQALVRFMENQYVSFDGVEDKFIKAFFVLPGHGNVIGLDNGIEEEIKEIALYQGE